MGLIQKIGYNLGLPSLGLSGLPRGTPWSAATPPGYQNLSKTGLTQGTGQTAPIPNINYGGNALSAVDYNQARQSGALSGGQPISTPGAVQGASTSGGGGGGGQYGGYNNKTDWYRATSGDPTGIPPEGWHGSGGGDPDAEARRIAEEQARLELENAMREFDRQSGLLQQQQTELEGQKSSLLSGFEQERGKARTQAETSTKQAGQATKTAQNKALSTAQDVERKNRNILRALGILSSSAAGEMLAKPYGEYQTTSADLQQAYVNRQTEIGQWLREREQEVDNAIRDTNTQFTNLTARIQSDMRYNGEQRAAAVQQAQLARSQLIDQINQRAQAYQQAANQYTAQMLQQIAQIQLYQNPQADVSGILSSSINAVNPGYNYQGELSAYQQKKKQTPYG